MKTEYTLIMLPQPILVSNETIKEGDCVLLPNNTIKRMSSSDMLDYLASESFATKKIVGGVMGLPMINYNGLEDKLQIEYDYDALGNELIGKTQVAFEKKYGYWLDTKENKTKPDYLYYSNYEIGDNVLYLHYGEYTRHDCPYSMTLELPLSDPSYPKCDVAKEINRNLMIEFADYVGLYYSKIGNPVVKTEDLLDKFLSETRTIKVEIELEYKDGFGYWYDYTQIEAITTNFEPLALRPKITDNSIKIISIK